ncbi:hypothetical protein BV25DRAFT_717402 [Artomyces pyxidatus]|uniref:Uncharacterized protein n=1 Tax=Artomyces pyxidatus TaxID=48021 RepID=A0ACB8T0I6_9AGAM|nr:hypothetical protein BV25DRAFT_717402 [Artomyces pyxidatus]
MTSTSTHSQDAGTSLRMAPIALPSSQRPAQDIARSQTTARASPAASNQKSNVPAAHCDSASALFKCRAPAAQIGYVSVGGCSAASGLADIWRSSARELVLAQQRTRDAIHGHAAAARICGAPSSTDALRQCSRQTIDTGGFRVPCQLSVESERHGAGRTGSRRVDLSRALRADVGRRLCDSQGRSVCALREAAGALLTTAYLHM